MIAGLLRKLKSETLRGSRVITIGCAISFVALVITACVTDQSAIGRVVMALNENSSPLPKSTQQELSRFEQTYNAYASDASDRERLDYFNFAYRRVRASYVYDVDDQTLINAAIAGVTENEPEPNSIQSQVLVEDALHKMLKALDPHSSYLDAEEFRDSFANTKGEFGGLGIQITMEKELVKVISPIEGTPAERAGMLAGDLITHIDTVPVRGKSLRDAVRLMRGKPGEAVVLTVRRENTDDFDMRIVRDIIEVKSVRHSVEDDVGYIRITRFNEKTKSGILAAVADIREKTGNSLHGVILDLRNNPGGLLNQSVSVADSFLEQGKIVGIKGRDGRNERAYYADEGDLIQNIPMVILVNQGSASASEIVASALQFHSRAVVMGNRTFGKGSVQTIMPMPLEGALRITTALYYSPSDQTLQALGVTPDIVVIQDTDAEALPPRRREADLPGAIPAQNEDEHASKPRISESACPTVGENKDHVLGCAIEYLRSGNQEAFLRRFAPAGQG